MRKGSWYSPGPGSTLEERSFLRPGPRAGAQEDQPVPPPSWSDVADGAALHAVPWKEIPPPQMPKSLRGVSGISASSACVRSTPVFTAEVDMPFPVLYSTNEP